MITQKYRNLLRRDRDHTPVGDTRVVVKCLELLLVGLKALLKCILLEARSIIRTGCPMI